MPILCSSRRAVGAVNGDWILLPHDGGTRLSGHCPLEISARVVIAVDVRLVSVLQREDLLDHTVSLIWHLALMPVIIIRLQSPWVVRNVLIIYGLVIESEEVILCVWMKQRQFILSPRQAKGFALSTFGWPYNSFLFNTLSKNSNLKKHPYSR